MNKEGFKVMIAGLGYIGLPTAALIAKHKIAVVGFDINEEVVNTINKGRIHIVEPDLDGLVKNVIEDGYLKASITPERADVFIIAVPTPLEDGNVPDVTLVDDATHRIIPYLDEGNLFIIESTSPVGTTERIKEMIYSYRPELKGKLKIAYCPERVLPGKILYELEHNDRVIGGVDDESTDAAVSFYSVFVKAELHRTGSKTAEMCKLTENSARDVSIAFANELSMICDKAGIDVWELIRLANKHPRISILQPGTGVGGHCIAVDPWFIVSDFPEEAQIIRTAREINKYKSEWVLQKIRNAIHGHIERNMGKPKVALMGLAFKPDIDDLRESPALYIAQSLSRERMAEYLFVEPNLNNHSQLIDAINSLTPALIAYMQADIVVFLVAHREFYHLEQVSGKMELDFCGIRK